MFRRRAGWLSALFLGEMLTATAMAFFEDEIARAVVLALFVPLIISSGGNSGSQASTLVVRAMSLGEVRLADWWRVVRRELASGLALGSLLGSIGFLRIVVWQAVSPLYGEHYLLVGVRRWRPACRRGACSGRSPGRCCRSSSAGSASTRRARRRRSSRHSSTSPGS